MSAFQFLEQADVLDGDHGLVGEGLEQRDLLIAERTNLRPTNVNRPDGNSFAQQWSRETGTSSRYLLNRLGIRKLVINLCQKISDMNRLPINDSPAQGSRRLIDVPFGAGGMEPKTATG